MQQEVTHNTLKNNNMLNIVQTIKNYLNKTHARIFYSLDGNINASASFIQFYLIEYSIIISFWSTNIHIPARPARRVLYMEHK